MADMDRLTLNGFRQSGRSKGLSIENEKWGYVIRSGNRPPWWWLIGQLVAYFFGVTFVTAGLGLLLLPGFLPSEEFGPMRAGAAAFFVAVYLETAAGEAPAQLVLGYRGHMILVAEGAVDQLTLLREQLSRDLMGPMGLNLARRPEATRQRASRMMGRAA